MINPDSQDKSFFSTNQDAEEVQRILDRIDENLALRQALRDSGEITTGVKLSIPALPSLDRVNNLIHWLMMSTAPLHPSAGVRGMRGIYLRFLNLPFRIFGKMEINFNQRLRDLLGELSAFLHVSREQGNLLRSMVLNLEDELEENEDVIQNLQKINKSLQEKISEFYELDESREIKIAELTNGIHDLEGQVETKMGGLTDHIQDLERQGESKITDLTYHIQDLERQRESKITDLSDHIQELERQGESKITDLTDHIHNLERWLEAQDARMRGSEDWIRLVGTELQDVAREVRTLKGQNTAQLTPLRITRPREFAQKIQNMDGELKVNVGSGHKALIGYINIDFRDLPEVDIACDATAMPFAPNSLLEIASSHLVEHYREYEFKTRLLPYWFSLIKPGGSIRIICPNWQAMLDQLHSGKMSASQFKLLTFGGQDYDGDDHYAMYTPDTLTALLDETGFKEIRILAVDRDNGGCPEMELIAAKPA